MVDMERLGELQQKAVNDFGAALHAQLAVIGDRLGLYKELAESGPLTPGELAQRTGTTERYVREWLNAQAAGDYVTYDPGEERYSLSEEQALLMAKEPGPANVQGFFQTAVAAAKTMDRVEQAFRTGEGVGWEENDPALFVGTERFFRSPYEANLVPNWIPALEGVQEKLRDGARVVDIGTGHGASLILMAKAYPGSEFVGIDFHEESIAVARERAKEAGVDERVSFATSTAEAYSGEAYDLATMFNALHDMGDPAGAVRQIRSALKPDGTLMIVEPYAEDRLEENLSPRSRLTYSISTLICVPCSLAQDVGAALGAQAGEARIREVVTGEGFRSFRRAAETPMAMVLEAKP